MVLNCLIFEKKSLSEKNAHWKQKSLRPGSSESILHRENNILALQDSVSDFLTVDMAEGWMSF